MPASRASSRRGGLIGSFWTVFTVLAVLSCAPAREASSSLQTESSGEAAPPEAAKTAEDRTTWDRLLQGALDHTAGDRTYVESMAKDAPSERTRRLAVLLLEEWDLDPAHPRLQQPRLVWAPEADLRKLPPESRKRIAPFVIVQGVVGQDGTLQEPRLKASAGSPAVDEAALQAARQAAFRPARRTGGYEEQPASFTLRWYF